MVTLTIEDLAKFKADCLRRNDVALLVKVLEIEDYIHYNRIDGIELQIDWRRDREEDREELEK